MAGEILESFDYIDGNVAHGERCEQSTGDPAFGRIFRVDVLIEAQASLSAVMSAVKGGANGGARQYLINA
jgi:hypothetical protein